MLSELKRFPKDFLYGIGIASLGLAIVVLLVNANGHTWIPTLKANLMAVTSLSDGFIVFVGAILIGVIVHTITETQSVGNEKKILKIIFLLAPLPLFVYAKVLAQINNNFITERMDAVWTNAALVNPVFALMMGASILALSLMLTTGALKIPLITGTQHNDGPHPDYIRTNSQ